MPTNDKDKVFNPNNADTSMATLKNSPIRAAKIFVPALINFGFKDNT